VFFFNSLIMVPFQKSKLPRRVIQYPEPMNNEIIVKKEEDSVRIYKLCAECEGKIEIIGTGSRSQDPEIYIV
jgi:hypothetical protein